MTEKMRRVGVITKTHGLKGAVKVYPTTDDPGRLSVGSKVFIEKAQNSLMPVTIKSSSVFKNLFILTFEEFSDIEGVEGFKGCDIMAEDQSELLPEGTYYIDDLIGLSIVDEEGSVIGELSEVIVTGANDVYVAKSESGEILIPAIKDCIRSVSLEEGVMRVRLLPGLV